MPQGGRSLARAMDIVDIVVARSDGISARELQELTGLTQSTLYRIVQLLELRGMVFRAYRLIYPGPALAVFFATIGARIADSSREVLGGMSAELRSSTILGISGGAHGYCLLRDFSANRVFQEVKPGMRFPLTVGAMGKALLAFSNVATQEYAIRLSRDLTTASGESITRPTLYRELSSAREMGYWFSRNEVQAHTGGIFAPVMAGSKAIGVIGAVTFEQVLTDSEVESMKASVLAHSRKMSDVVQEALRSPEPVA